ncbi:uncharacterized protein LOC113082507 [Carassius auratus]|uniref:Uncharacterized protein LOC113082507 n=1 Tax=Carassius auratus TaxID=7957 RepID=A0A6P6NLI1_CARAU|nr:uncharacterized protein LOC113082507 [Carassius auratus]
MVGKLNELAQLRDSGFGRPQPRHGLRLLYWFANECVSFDEENNMLSECDPVSGEFGFHHFNNRCYGEKFLDEEDFPYYVVGNLNFEKYPEAEDLPDYVLEDKYTDEHNSNTDRIIVSLDQDWFHEVYVTQHLDRSNNYDPDATHRISRGLLMIIRRMSLEDFLRKMDYYTHTQPVRPQTRDFTSVSVSSSDSSKESIIQFNDDMPPQNSSENLPGLWERFCTIL